MKAAAPRKGAAAFALLSVLMMATASGCLVKIESRRHVPQPQTAAPPATPPAAPPAAARPGDPKRGAMLFGERGCNGCHMIDGVGGQVGPDLTKVGARDLARERPGGTWPSVEAYIRESIERPNAYVVRGFPNPSPMPPADLLLPTEQDRRDIIAYLLTRK